MLEPPARLTVGARSRLSDPLDGGLGAPAATRPALARREPGEDRGRYPGWTVIDDEESGVSDARFYRHIKDPGPRFYRLRHA
jgi:hypothetical protein